MAGLLPPCYHAGVSKEECENLLGKKAKDGAFLIRESETVKGVLCLCVYKQNIVYTYRVETSAGQYSLVSADGVNRIFFKTLKELISHYRKRDQGLATHLRLSVNRVTPPVIQPQLPHDQVSAGEEHVYDNVFATYVTFLPC